MIGNLLAYGFARHTENQAGGFILSDGAATSCLQLTQSINAVAAHTS